MSNLPDTLHAFGPSTLAVRAVGAVLSASGAAALDEMPTVEAALSTLLRTTGGPAASPTVHAAAAAAATDLVSTAVLGLGAAVDGADRALGRDQVTDEGPQTADAVLKAWAMAAIARRLGGADPAARVARLLELPSGKAMVVVWAAVDVVLPLGGVHLDTVFAQHRVATASRLAALAGEEALDGTSAVLAALTPALQAQVDRTVPLSGAIAHALAPFVPGLVPQSGAEQTIAVRSDRLPLYKWLAARIAAEHAVRRAAGF
ncbi:MAG: hypothetical protein ABMA64_17605 [Myxococcota bacterium]